MPHTTSSNAQSIGDGKSIRRLVVDSNSIINQTLSPSLADEFYVVPEMLDEIRDRRARNYLQSLSFPLIMKSPSEIAIHTIVEFSKKSGDIASLSLIDIKVLALTYMLQSESPNGVQHLRKEPKSSLKNMDHIVVHHFRKNHVDDNQIENGKSEDLNSDNVESKSNADDNADSEWQVQKKRSNRKPKRLETEGDWITNDNINIFQKSGALFNVGEKERKKFQDKFLNESDDESSMEQNDDTELKGLSFFNAPPDELPLELDITSESNIADNKFDDTNLLESQAKNEIPNEAAVECNKDDSAIIPGKKRRRNKKRGGKRVNKAKNKEPGQVLDDDAKSAGISPLLSTDGEQLNKSEISVCSENNTQPEVIPKEKNTLSNKDSNEIFVSCITADFAMQNVLLQMGLRLIGTDGLRIKAVKSWLLRCHACQCLSLNLSKQFCPDCGHSTLLKVAYSVNNKGLVHIYLKNNFRYINRGNKYAIPLPKGGKKGNDLILAEDQKEYQKALLTQRRFIKATSTEKDFGFFDSFGAEKTSNFKHVTATGKIIIGKGNRNANVVRRKRK